MRICLVTPFAWSQPHDVNEHVAGVAAGSARLGHSVTVLAPSTRAADLLAGRRVIQGHAPARDVVAVGPAVPISRRSQMGVPVGVQANLRLALARGRYDVVHGFEPGLPSLSYLALRDTDALTVATFCSTDRLGYPPARSQREKLLARHRRAARALRADPGRRRRSGSRATTSSSRPASRSSSSSRARSATRITVELRPNERPGRTRRPPRAARAAGLGGGAAAHDAARRTAGDSARPRRPRLGAHGPRRQPRRAPLLAETAIFVPGADGLPRVLLEAQAAGCAIAAPGRGSSCSPSSQPPRPPASPRTRSSARPRGAPAAPSGGGPVVRRRRGAARRALRAPDQAAAQPPAPRARRPARRPALDPRRPAHAHLVVVRLRRRPGGARRSRGGRRARSDRGHRPQRLRRSARDRSTRPAAAT